MHVGFCMFIAQYVGIQEIFRSIVKSLLHSEKKIELGIRKQSKWKNKSIITPGEQNVDAGKGKKECILGSALRNLQHRSGRNGVILVLGWWGRGQAREARQEGARASPSEAEAC